MNAPEPDVEWSDGKRRKKAPPVKGAEQWRLDRIAWSDPAVGVDVEWFSYWKWHARFRDADEFPTEALEEQEQRLREEVLPDLQARTGGVVSTMEGSEWLKLDKKFRRLRGQLHAIMATLRERRAGVISRRYQGPPAEVKGMDPFF